MRKVLIIDDEPIVREGLKSVITWEDFGYKVCGIGTDGRDGLNKIRQLQPDLVLIDIRMPGFSGIDIIQQIKNEGYMTKFIILSGYSSFSYAKESMKLGISSYLLKPIDENELIHAVNKVSEEIEKEEKIYNQLSLFKRINEEQSFKKMLEGKCNEIETSMLVDFEQSSIQVARILYEETKWATNWIIKKVEQKPNHIKMVTKDNHFHLLFIEEEQAEVKVFLTELITELTRLGSTHCNVLLGNQVIGPKEVSLSYKQTKKLMDVHFCYSKQHLISFDMLQAENSNVSFVEIQNKLCRFMEFQESNNLNNELEEIEKYYQHTCFSQEKIKAELIDFTISIFSTIKQNHPSITCTKKEDLVDQIFNQSSLQSLIGYIYDELINLSQSINVHTSNRNTIDKIKDYVNQYYYEEDLNLKVLADLFNYNSSYLGKKFKKQTGEYFHTYLDIVRINKAKEALTKGEEKVYEISEKIGYCNIDYFYKKFKRYEGISPKEYQKSIRNDTNSRC
ncbi:response regulator [Aquibacillus rhizosphaerae]|uniref:Response regulator n=1 Tax=Aquibacillus rhizosphaerae TaxID=3051431 RepID=A0ABT7L9I2_9BACI|nr:response regulator [Aquibacillus sp. LR5S19]MDL4841897.1 response regulator [Aquibacillus sp. LR5S19]